MNKMPSFSHDGQKLEWLEERLRIVEAENAELKEAAKLVLQWGGHKGIGFKELAALLKEGKE